MTPLTTYFYIHSMSNQKNNNVADMKPSAVVINNNSNGKNPMLVPLVAKLAANATPPMKFEHPVDAKIAKLQRKLVQAKIELSKIRSHTIFQLLEDRRQLRIQLVHSRTEKQLQYQALLKEHEEILGEVRAECHRKCRMMENELHQLKETESRLNSEVRRLKEMLVISQNNTCNDDMKFREDGS